MFVVGYRDSAKIQYWGKGRTRKIPQEFKGIQIRYIIIYFTFYIICVHVHAHAHKDGYAQKIKHQNRIQGFI